MSRKHRRYSLKSKEVKTLLSKASGRLKVDVSTFIDSKANVDVVEADFGDIFLIKGRPLLFRAGTQILPTLLFTEVFVNMPKVVVDMGAVPYVCNGADIMAPGIERMEGRFIKGDIVVVVDEKHGKPLSLGEILYDAEEARKIEQGIVVRNIHFVSDKIWNFSKTFAG